MKRLSYILFLILIFPMTTKAWWSLDALGLSTHRKISEKAVTLLNNTTDYPDIRRFGNKIINATTGPTNDANAHGKIKDVEMGYTGRDDAGKFDGGPFKKWKDFSQKKYKKSKFISGEYPAYYYIGLMAHLTQDQAVPAHAAFGLWSHRELQGHQGRMAQDFRRIGRGRADAGQKLSGKTPARHHPR